MNTTLQELEMIVMIKRTNSNLSTVYVFIPLDILLHEVLVTLNTTVQVLEMILMLKRTIKYIIQLFKEYHYVLIINKKYYVHVHSSEMTIVKPTNTNTHLK